MNKLKFIIFIETIIVICLAYYIYQVNNNFSQEKSYYTKNGEIKLLSPIVDTGIIPSSNFLIYNLEPLKLNILDYIQGNNFNVSMYVVNFRNSASFGINSSETFDPASLNKLPVAIIILKKIEEGKLSLDTQLPITDDERDNSSGILYKLPIDHLDIKHLLYYMLSESDNTALWTLGKQVTLEDLQHLSIYLDYYQNNINYSSQYPIKNDFKISTKSTSNLFSSLYLSTVLQPKDSELILSYLLNTSFDIKKYSNITDDTIIAQKYGVYNTNDKNDKKEFHSCGIIYIKESRFFYCIMTKDLEKEKASQVIGNIVNRIYNYIIEQRKINNIDV